MTTKWTQEQFAKLQKIARRHAVRCPLRLAMATGEDPDGTRVCNCNGQIDLHGEVKETPRERTLEDVVKEIGDDGEEGT